MTRACSEREEVAALRALMGGPQQMSLPEYRNWSHMSVDARAIAEERDLDQFLRQIACARAVGAHRVFRRRDWGNDAVMVCVDCHSAAVVQSSAHVQQIFAAIACEPRPSNRGVDGCNCYEHDLLRHADRVRASAASANVILKQATVCRIKQRKVLARFSAADDFTDVTRNPTRE